MLPVAAALTVVAAVAAVTFAVRVAKATASAAVAVTDVPLVKVTAPSLEVAVKAPAPLRPMVPPATVLVAVTLPAAAVVTPTLILPAVPLVIVTFLPPSTATPAKPFATLMSVVAAATTPEIARPEATFNVVRPVKPETLAAVIAAAEVTLAISTPVTVAPAAVAKEPPAETMFNVSIPAPPLIESREENESTPAIKAALMVSLPAVPVMASILVVSVRGRALETRANTGFAKCPFYISAKFMR